MRLKSLALGAVLGCLCLSAAVAQEEPQVVRQDLMKGIGQSMGALGAIAKGEKPYDAAVVQTSLETISTNAKAFPDQFPEGSETGMESDAAPAIWENMADFEAKAEKLATEADTLLAAVPADQAGVGAALKTLGGTCGDCHQTYRLKR
ncbi:MAG: cytochrome c [Alphaproteobacteria bacterium]|jgi:cytochrome c556|nr:cytochrome c [Alphaproteobacteria bacterium]MBU1551175.1 cytochrome c [Alphaproteobacteria bacterium]MBU2334956.1 cytochrome c [Alphaproteobacteria bacterium]MBU2388854.1 cytochrome c [Alphaproteobacteria bacterium]|tara:strand:- start:50 stop:493 length:444 start_codon:yes stop_codon:yes gene_type:complete